MKKASYIVVGAGQRGSVYSNYTREYSDEAEIVAVCEPLDDVRDRFGDEYGIPRENRFGSWTGLLGRQKLADAVLLCTQDKDHREPAVALAALGYHILLEKPMAPDPDDCRAICDAAISNEIMLAVCHVLRYTWLNRKLKEMIDSGVIGSVRNIQLIEPVGYWHQAHSFVRGHWRNEQQSSPMLLAKSCHDLDLLNYFMPSRCTKAASFGSLSYFTRENQPLGAADRCLDCPPGIESNCSYSANKIYLKDRENAWSGWPSSVLTPVPTRDAISDALRKGPYGRCVFACDNNVVDHQVVMLEFEDGATAGFTMTAFTEMGDREIYIMGDSGTLRSTVDGIEHVDFLTDRKRIIPRGSDGDEVISGHGGGDYGLMKEFTAAVRHNDPSRISSGPEVSLESHLIVFAAERARRNGTVENVCPASSQKQSFR